MKAAVATIGLNVASWQEKTIVNGPGERFALWLQGCPFRCPGCFNPDFLPFVPRKTMTVDDVATLIERVSGIEGVTFSGGEPMAQADSLVPLARRLKDKGLTLVCYSGYTWEELQANHDPSVAELLSLLDLLIDGRYDATQQTTLPWRGSRNQRVHFLSPAYRHLEPTVNEARTEVEFIVGRDGYVSTGMLSAAPLRTLERLLNEG